MYAGRLHAQQVLAAVDASVHAERLTVVFLAGPESGAAPSLMLEYQKSRRRRAALGLACGFDALKIITKLGVMTHPIDSFLTQFRSQFLAFRAELNSESDRGCALFAAAYLDRALSDVLFVSMVDAAKLDSELFKNQGPLDSFSSRIRMSFYLGKISAATRADLERIRSIRNDFAHRPNVLSFNHASVRDRCSTLTQTWGTLAPVDQAPRSRFIASVTTLLAYLGAEVLEARAPMEKIDQDRKFQIKVLKSEAPRDPVSRLLARWAPAK